MLSLTQDQQGLLDGARGEAAALAMRIVTGAAELLGAPRLIPVASAHIDGALYHGDAGTLFCEKLRDLGAKTAIPATLNVGALDLHCGTKTRLPPHERAMAKRLMLAHEQMGCKATWTCAPYQAGHRPALGTDVAWGESNAVVFCNSVLGARTNRYGDYLDICCAISGLAPYYGLHDKAKRVARVVLDCSGLAAGLRDADPFWPVLGTWYGREIGGEIGVIDGLQGFASEDRLKALGAAMASTGAVALFHAAGVTPEAATVELACGGETPKQIITLKRSDLEAALASLSTATGNQVDAIAIGSPHLSIAEFRQLEALIAGRKLQLPFYACTGRHAILALEQEGRRAGLEAAGVSIIADTCVVVTPILRDFAGVLMTNSGKFAHYAPGNTGYATQYGSTRDCVESAVSGRLIRDLSLWQ